MEETKKVETPETNYIEQIQNLKKNTVSIDEYNRVLSDNKQLVEALMTTGPATATEPEAKIATDSEVQALINQLDKPNISNLDFIEASLALREARLSRGEDDPWAPTKEGYTDTDRDRELRDDMAAALAQTCAYARSVKGKREQAKLFDNELMRICR